MLLLVRRNDKEGTSQHHATYLKRKKGEIQSTDSEYKCHRLQAVGRTVMELVRTYVKNHCLDMGHC